MSSELKGYLFDVGRQLHLEPGQEREILRELQTHVEERAEELMQEGVPPDQALHKAVRSMGLPKELARRMYSVHSPSSWWEALVAATPHLLLALFFALHLWTRVIWIVVLLAAASVVSLRGWRRGRPGWTYPWLGYSLAAPVLSGVVSAAALAYGVWSLLSTGSTPLYIPLYGLMALYVLFALWVVGSLAVKVVRRDWLLASLTAMPLPLLLSWLLFIQEKSPGRRPEDADANTALVFLALALITAVFFRVGQRVLRVGLLVVAIPILTYFAYLTYMGSPGALIAALLVLACAAFLLSPILLESKVGHAQEWTLYLEKR